MRQQLARVARVLGADRGDAASVSAPRQRSPRFRSASRPRAACRVELERTSSFGEIASVHPGGRVNPSASPCRADGRGFDAFEHKGPAVVHPRIGCAHCCWGVLAIGMAGWPGKVSGPDAAAHASRRPSRRRATWTGTRARSPAKRGKNDGAIDKLLAGLDDATLSADAAALPAGDALYIYAGRACCVAAWRCRGLTIAARGTSTGSPARRRDGYRPRANRSAAALVGQFAPPLHRARRFLHRLLRRNPPRPEVRSTTPQARRKPQSPRIESRRRRCRPRVGPLGRDEASRVFERARHADARAQPRRQPRRRRATRASRCRRRTTASPRRIPSTAMPPCTE